MAASRVGAHPRKTPTTGPAAAESAAAESVAQARAVPESAAAGRGVAVRPRVCGGWADRAGREVGSPEQCRATRCPRLQNHAAGSPNGGTSAASDGVLSFGRRSGGGHGGAGTTPDLARAETLSHGRATRSPDAEEPHPGLVLQPQHLADGVRAEDHLLRLRSDLAAGPEREQQVGRLRPARPAVHRGQAQPRVRRQHHAGREPHRSSGTSLLVGSGGTYDVGPPREVGPRHT